MSNKWLEEHEAIDKDFGILFSEFDKLGSVRFDDFSRVWRSLKMSFIHSGRKHWYDKMRATERIFRVLSKYLTEASSFQFRIATIYALYSTYHTQLCEAKVKIRLTPTMWKELCKLKALVKEQQHYDVEYIINKMVNEKAFVFCAMPFPLEFLQNEFMLKKDSAVDPSQVFGYEPSEYIQDLVENLDPIKKISKVEQDYVKAKEKILEHIDDDQKAFSTRKKLSSIEENLHGRLLDYTEDFHRWLVTKTSFGKHKTEIWENLQKPSASFEPANLKSSKESVDEASNEASAELSKPSEASQRSAKMEALKMKAFKATSEKSIGSAEDGEEASTENDNNVIETDEQEGVSSRRTFYRRSAVRERYSTIGRRQTRDKKKAVT